MVEKAREGQSPHRTIYCHFLSPPPPKNLTSGAKDLLLEWVRSKIPEYNIKNFNSDWNDGRAFCALTNAVGTIVRVFYKRYTI